jgi:hypothetical protein
LLKWPWRRFEAFYEAHAKRLAVKQAVDHRNAMVTGLWANSNLDDGKDTRKQFLTEIDNSLDETLATIYGKKEPEIDFNTDPFFAAMKLPDEGNVPDRTTTTEDIEVDQVD